MNISSFSISLPLRASAVALSWAGLFLSLSAELTAQDSGRQVAGPSASEILITMAGVSREDGNLGTRLVRGFLAAEPEPVQLDSLVNGLVQLAVAYDNVRVRREAVQAAFLWAQADVERNPRRVIEVLESVYDGTPDASSKATIAARMAELGPRAGVIAFLRRVAVTEETPWEGIPALAIESLAKLGEPGRAVLRELHAQKAVTVWRAWRRLEDLAQRDFRIG